VPQSESFSHFAIGAKIEGFGVISAVGGWDWFDDVCVGVDAVAEGLRLPGIASRASLLLDVIVSIVVPGVVFDGDDGASGGG